MENADVLFTEDRKLRVELKFIERHEEENTHLDYLPYCIAMSRPSNISRSVSIRFVILTDLWPVLLCI